ncbi:unnamed protein product [Miscanthus lutarioriparius]|uniref:Bifunctional inhibitor/plant lipid transfer protein/seed storage helical domain-containing protein n=1 Tax=Miscanthus lutarioriparius TaxID=422564 RepID=A0A811MU97_9POAL|nr:unnamed protein product [Miscanthus lutarioriparius]
MVSASSTLLATATLLLLLSAAGAAEAAATPTPPQAQAAAAAAGAACHNDIVALRTTCYDYVQEGGRTLPPSSNCCATLISLTNVPCVCDYLGSDLDIDLDKVLYVCRSCGVAIPRGCGGQYLTSFASLGFNAGLRQRTG